MRCIKADGLYEWQKTSGATRQSLAENAVSPFKALLGGALAARRSACRSEVREPAGRGPGEMPSIEPDASLGMPKSERIQLGRPV